jgi:hypothetical protein
VLLILLNTDLDGKQEVGDTCCLVADKARYVATVHLELALTYMMAAWEPVPLYFFSTSHNKALLA